MLSVLLFISVAGLSQSKIDEAQLKKANELFEDKDYLEALGIYRQLLSVTPEDKILNYKYGACLIFTDEETDVPIKYLKFGVTQDVDATAYYFLGKAFHLNYQFADAINAFENYASKATKQDKKRYSDVGHLIQISQNGQSLLKEIKDIMVIDKTEASINEFFRSYNINDIDGKIIVTPDELLSKKDKASGERSLVFFRGSSPELYFSSYGDSDQRDIYMAKRLKNGKFTKPVKVAGGINTEYDENYPFLHPDGETLYFSSKGHNTMGGYDVFQSTLNPNTGTFGVAVNLDFAISSPGDDVFYITDLNKEFAYFASNRSTEVGQVNVYHVRVEAGVANLAMIKGKYIATEDSGPVTIRVEDAMTNAEIGVYQSDSKTGEYLMNLPRSGKYKFYVEHDGDNVVHSGIFEVPRSKGMIAYAQEMTFTNVNGAEQLVLNNLFDKPLTDDIDELMVEALKRKAQLNINKDEFIIDKPTDEFSFENASEIAGFDKSNEELIADIKRDKIEATEGSATDIFDARTIFAYAQMQKEAAEVSLKKAKQAYLDSKSENDNSKKEELILEAAFNKSKSIKYNQNAANAIAVVKLLDKNSKDKYERYSELEILTYRINESTEAEDADKMVSSFKEYRVIDDKGVLPGALELIQESKKKRKAEANKSLTFAKELDSEVKSIEDKIGVKEKLLSSVKKKKEKEALEDEINGLKRERQDYKEEVQSAYKRYELRLKNQDNTEGQGKLFSEYKLRREGDVWSDLTVVEYSPQAINEYESDIRANKREMDKIQISDVEVEQLLAQRSDISHKFPFGDIEFGDLGEFRDTNEGLNTENLELIDEEEANVEVEERTIESEDSFESFMSSPGTIAEPIIAFEDKIKEYNNVLASVEPQKAEVLKSRILRLEELIEQSKRDEEILASTSKETIQMSQTDFSENSRMEMVNWVAPDYETKKKLIINADITPDEKQSKFKELNSEFNDILNKEEALLMDIYRIQNIGETPKAIANLDYITKLKNEFSIATLDEEELNVVNDVVVEESEIIDEITSDNQASDNSMEEILNDNVDSIETIESIENSGDIVKEINDDNILEGEGTSEDFVDDAAEQNLEEEEIAAALDDNLEGVEELTEVADELQEDINIPEDNDQESVNDNSELTDNSTSLFADTKELTLDEKIELAKLLDLETLTQEVFREIQDIDESNSSNEIKSNQKIQLLVDNRRVLQLKKQQIFELLNNEEKERKLEVIVTLQNAINYDLDKETVALSEIYAIPVTQLELIGSRTHKGYIEELNSIITTDTEEDEKAKKKMVLDNAVAMKIEREMIILTALSKEVTKSEEEKSYFFEEAERLEEDLLVINESVANQLANLNLAISQEELYDRQKNRAYATDDNKRESDYTRLIKTEGYKRTELEFLEAKILQEEANNELILLENNRSTMSDEEYLAKEIRIGDKISRANAIELDKLSEITSDFDFETLKNQELSSMAKELLDESQGWVSTINSLNQLIDRAEGEQRNVMLKEKVAAQMNAIESKRYAQAIVNYLGSDNNEDQSMVFDNFIVPNSSLNELQDEPNYDLTSDIFEENYQAPSFTEEGEIADTESEIIEDEISSKASNNRPLESLIVLLDEESITKEDKNNARKRLRQDQLSRALSLNVNGINLSEEKLSILDEGTFDSDKEREIAQNNLLIKQMEEMKLGELERKKLSQELLFTKKHGLDVVIETIQVDGKTDVLAKEHNRLVSEINQLDEYIEISDNNVESLDKQCQIVNEKIIALNELEDIVLEEPKEEVIVEAEDAFLVDSIDIDSPSTTEFNPSENISDPIFPSVLTSSIFSRSNDNPIYSDENRIPIDPIMPEGIIYQVQVGAYRKPIPQDLFKGFAPIMGQLIHSGITRYKVGLFTNYDAANSAKNEIVGLGYSDAFVIVFNSGERLSLAEAKSISASDAFSSIEDNSTGFVEEGEEGFTDNTSSGSTSDALDSSQGNQDDFNDNSTGITGSTTNTLTTDGTGIEELTTYEFVEDDTKDDYFDNPSNVEANQVEMMKGLFYTVQIGAYSNPVTYEQLMNVKPINTELTNSGVIRYTSGVYTNLNSASNYRLQVIDKGIADAFISAYYNGYRIKLSKAQVLLEEYGDDIWVDSSMISQSVPNVGSTDSVLPADNTNSVVEDVVEDNNEDSQPSTGYESKDDALDAAYTIVENGMPGQMVWKLLEEEGLLENIENATFKVVLGPFVEAIPTREVEIILDFSDNIRFEERGENEYVYSSINPISYTEAKELQQRLEEEGITTAKIVSLQNGKEMSMKEFLDAISE